MPPSPVDILSAPVDVIVLRQSTGSRVFYVNWLAPEHCSIQNLSNGANSFIERPKNKTRKKKKTEREKR